MGMVKKWSASSDQIKLDTGDKPKNDNLDEPTDVARPTLADIAECLSFSPGDGRIWLSDQRMMLLHSGAFGALRGELVESLGIEKARGLMTRMGYLGGAKDARLQQERWPDADLAAFYQARLHSLEGMLKVEPLHFKFDTKSGYFEGEYLWHHSVEADEQIATQGIGTFPCCWMAVGYAIGHGSTLLGHLLIAREVSCRAMGDSACRVVVKSAELWDNVEEDMRYLNAETFVNKRMADVPVSVPVSDDTAPSKAAEGGQFYQDGLVGVSAAFNAACHQLQRVAGADATVLFTGESGVGKEMFANMLHRISKRGDRSFLAVNCAAIPENLVEVELFGVEKGAFTGAVQSRPGRFERADGGTLFLDEIGTLSLSAQGKLLRVLQEGEVERVGGIDTLPVDVRVVAATNVNLRQAVKDGSFREDLFYRLNVFPIQLPPLRERREDIPLLMNYFLNLYCRKYDRNVPGFTQRAVKALLYYSFPGNIRELQNLVERGVISTFDGDQVDLPHLFVTGEEMPGEIMSLVLKEGKGGLANEEVGLEMTISPPDGDLLDTVIQWQKASNHQLSLEDIERTLVENAISQCDGNLSAAARLLGISRSQIGYRCEKYKQSEPSR
ncbi:MAG: sigma 54-interacting transcriptional regulator [Motiliproteus sp.]